MLATLFLLLMLDTVMLVFYLARNRAVYVLSLVFGLPLKWVLNGGEEASSEPGSAGEKGQGAAHEATEPRLPWRAPLERQTMAPWIAKANGQQCRHPSLMTPSTPLPLTTNPMVLKRGKEALL